MPKPSSHPFPYSGAQEKPASILTAQNAPGHVQEKGSCPLLQSWVVSASLLISDESNY